MKIEISKEAAEKEVALISKRIFAWNLVGCISNAATSFLMLSFVTRNTNLTEAGYFSIAFATAQLFLTVGKYGVRAYQATDVKYSIERKLLCSKSSDNFRNAVAGIPFCASQWLQCV